MAVPGAWTLRWMLAAVLAAAEATPRRKAPFMALQGLGRTYPELYPEIGREIYCYEL